MVSILEIKKVRRDHPIIFWLFVGASFAIVAIFCFYIYIAYLLPLPNKLASFENMPSTKIFDRNGVLLYEVLKPEFGKSSVIPLDRIPKTLTDATLAAEDINFYSHDGVDVGAIARALFFNAKEGYIVSGASTITQQVVRNMIGKTNRDVWDKALEAAYAIRLTHMYSKDKIFELYLNKIYYGNLSYGAEAAAQNYFGQHIYDLDAAQITFIAGLPQSPSRYNPYNSFESAKNRQKYVLDRMVKNGMLTQSDANDIFNEKLKLHPNKYPIKAPHFVYHVLSDLEARFGSNFVHNGGLQITTTLDYNLQMNAKATIKRHIKLLSNHNVTNGALVAQDVHTSQILAWVGSADYFDEDIDGAVDIVTSLRQPGSSIKPLTYLLAFEKGYNPATVLYDVPTQFPTETGPYSPKNYDLKFHGPVRVRTALASSYNIPAVKTLEYVGIGNFISFLRDLGIDTLTGSNSHYGLALTLGGGEVRIIDMVQAYSVLANYGNKSDYSTLLKVEDGDGNVLYEWEEPKPEFVLERFGAEHCALIIDILSDPNARIPGFGDRSVLDIPHDAAVKTGTTRNFRDNWTVGFSPNLLTAVWVGNADASAMKNVTGATGAAPIWADFMEESMKSTPNTPFKLPPSIVEKEICALSGKLPTEYCNDKMYEIFSPDSVPIEKDDYYKLFNINTQTGKIIPAACLNSYSSAQIKQKTLVAYPPKLQKWALNEGLQLPTFSKCTDASDYPVAYTDEYSDEQANEVIIDSPANNDEYILDNTIPLTSQKIPLRVSAPHETTTVDFFIDDTLVGSLTKTPYTTLWLPTLGKHTFFVRAILFNGRTIDSNKLSFSIM